MIPSMFIVHVDRKLTHKQQAPDNSSALVNKTAASQTVIHRLDKSDFEMHRPAQRQPQSVQITLALSTVGILDCTSILGSKL